MKIFTKTFGCQMNFADSEEILRHFRKRGFSPSLDEKKADAILINTCTVRDLAEQKARSYMGRLKGWKEARPGRFLVVTGCAAERAKKEWRQRYPHVDLIVGAKDIDVFDKALEKVWTEKFSNEEQLTVVSPSHLIQYVTIMRGCNYNCSYCIVPAVRGRERYRPIADIRADVQARIDEGAKEIWLLGQTVNSYKPPNPPFPDYDFSDLLRDVNQIPGLERLRFMSPHPYYLTPKLIEAMATCDTVCEHMHLPVQSGSSRLLKRMKRNYTRESYLSSLASLRKRIPNISITTDIIVGFPGETNKDFEETLSLVKEADFDSAYCFKYSPRPGTASAEWDDDVSNELKEERLQTLLDLVELRGRQKAKAMIGTTHDVLVEDDKGDGLFRGKTRGPWRVRIQNADLRVGQTIRTTITDSYSRELHGVC